MAGPFHFAPAYLSTWITGFACLGVSIWLWTLNRRGLTVNPRATRALTLILFFLAGDFICSAFEQAAAAAGDALASAQWHLARDRFYLAIDLPAFYFLLVYPRPRT